MADIFISYARADRARLQPFLDDLDRQGLSYFIDEQGIRTGEDWSERIVSALKSARIVVTFWSETSVRSDHVRDEARIALSVRTYRGVRLDPVDLPLGFGSYQVADFINKTPADNGRLWADVIGANEPGPDCEPQDAPRPHTPRPEPKPALSGVTGGWRAFMGQGLSAQVRMLRLLGSFLVVGAAITLSYFASLAILMATGTITAQGLLEEDGTAPPLAYAVAVAIFAGVYPLLRFIVRILGARLRALSGL